MQTKTEQDEAKPRTQTVSARAAAVSASGRGGLPLARSATQVLLAATRRPTNLSRYGAPTPRHPRPGRSPRPATNARRVGSRRSTSPRDGPKSGDDDPPESDAGLAARLERLANRPHHPRRRELRRLGELLRGPA